MTELQLKQWLAKMSKSCQELNRRLSIEIPYPHETANGSSPLPGPEPEPAVCHDPLAEGPGTEKGAPRIVVRLTSFRQRLLDPDNLCPKSLVDGLRYAGIIPDDRPQDIELSVSQQRCKASEERTVIEVDLP